MKKIYLILGLLCLCFNIKGQEYVVYNTTVSPFCPTVIRSYNGDTLVIITSPGRYPVYHYDSEENITAIDSAIAHASLLLKNDMIFQFQFDNTNTLFLHSGKLIYDEYENGWLINSREYQYPHKYKDYIIIPDTISSYIYCNSDSSLYNFTITGIENNTFFNNDSLLKVKIPQTVNYIGEKAFMNCINLDTIICENPFPPTTFENTFQGMSPNAVLIVPCGKINLYSQALGWNNFSTIIENRKSITENVSETICEGDSYVLGDLILETSGSYTDTLQSIEGCDSIVNLELTVNPSYIQNIEVSMLNGEVIEVGNESFEYPGTYTVELKTENGCDSIVILSLFVGLDEIRTDIECQISPNPTKGNTTLNISSLKQDSEIRIIDNKGEVVFRHILKAGEKCIILPTATLSSGIYYIEVGNLKKRLIKQ